MNEGRMQYKKPCEINATQCHKITRFSLKRCQATAATAQPQLTIAPYDSLELCRRSNDQVTNIHRSSGGRVIRQPPSQMLMNCIKYRVCWWSLHWPSDVRECISFVANHSISAKGVKLFNYNVQLVLHGAIVVGRVEETLQSKVGSTFVVAA
ncbi:unnamed protein product [Ceratitis capitata]|uniref:(Mediterranean fruit fly) hypothetical protein n=1 Tax=Ceratitis capitata TaxID=7213 RepID=A0A811U4U3_CERCA|nr:unnamed protein product [Ceratitis capitata]